jgi:hypothetical protein
MISSLGDSGLPVFQAGHCDWQRPHSVQVAMSSMAVHLKSSTLATPKTSSSGSASSRSRTLPLLIIGSSPPRAVPSGLRLVSTLIGAVKMCRCLEYVTSTRKPMMTAMWARIMTSSSRAAKVSPSGSIARLSSLLKNGAHGVSCQGEVPCASCAARMPNSVATTRPIIPSTTQAARVCEP